MSNIIRAIFNNVNDKEVFAKARYQYDYGMILRFEGAVTLPSAFEVHFALEKHGEAITQIGDPEGVSVPDALFLAGKTIYAWAYLHSGEDDGYTEYMVQIPVIKRAQPSDEVPTPVQQSAIDQAIAALGVAVEQTAADVETTTEKAAEAQASAEAAAASAAEAAETAENVEENVTAARAAKAAAEAARDRAVQAETSAGQSKTAAASSETNAAASATAASASAAAALTSEENANGAMLSAYSDANRADTAADTATSAKNDAVTAKNQAQSAKTSAETAATTATQKASAAATSADTATTKATAAANSATAAAGSATAAANSATEAATTAQGISEHLDQIDENTDAIDALKEDFSAYVGNHTGNLYNKNNDLLGKGITASGEIIDNANYKLSDLIYIGPDKTFTFETKYYAGMNSGVSNIAYYDADKHFSARVSVSTDETVTITTKAYRYYIRLVMFINTPDLMCNMGNTILPYAPYGLDYCNYLSHNASKVYDFEMGGITLYGTLVENNIRARSAQIYFPNNISNPKLVFKCNAEYIFSVMVFFDEYGNYSRSFSQFIYFANKLIEVPINEGESSFIISFKKANDAEFTTEEITNIKATCYFRDVASYEEVNKIRQNVNALQTGHWYGKKYTALGDSITYGFIPRNYTGYPGQLDSYAKLTAEALGMTFDNQGVSGSTMAYVEGRSPMSRRYSSLPDDADLITVMGGTNDIRNGVPLGTMNDRTDATFYGALHVVLGGLYKKYFIDQGVSEGKEKKIVVCTPIKLLYASAENQGGTGTLVDMSAWVEAVKEVADYYSLPVLDFYNMSGINPHLNETIQGTEQGYTGFYNPYITDGTHPTQEGQQIMADVLCGFLKTLI